ncbi:hypothetical protein DSO57_1003112 [Entomophthora muscae]|uniref:Uncharacterized protein n=1 Tax=Entomophthora muscae TaxID=34485 RepID=A0ACC2UUS8_9FUNG|nr:hypothetical protein DSO57_1003112 [Entomophthora muscae]
MYNLKLTFSLKIDNSLPWETRAQGWDSNPEPIFLRAAGPMDQGPVCPQFFGIEPMQAKAPLSPKARIPAQDQLWWRLKRSLSNCLMETEMAPL